MKPQNLASHSTPALHAQGLASGATVHVSGVSKRFQRARLLTQALERVDLNIESGEFVAVVGPSGCGKSTLLKIIAGLLDPSEGQVVIDQKPVQGPHTDLGIVFQSPVLLDWRNILDNVLVQIELRGQDPRLYRDRAKALLSKVGLSEFENRMPRELSGGMRQRAAIVRALIHEPPLLLMDEPFGALDALTREQMRIDLEKLWLDRGQTTFFITHGISEAVALADRVIVMSPRPGRIEQIIPIDLPRPRDKSVVTSSLFNQYCEQITECFMRHGVIQY